MLNSPGSEIRQLIVQSRFHRYQRTLDFEKRDGLPTLSNVNSPSTFFHALFKNSLVCSTIFVSLHAV